MCGRFAHSRSDAQLVAAFGIDEVESAELPPSYNVAPTQDVRIIMDSTRGGHGDGEEQDAGGHGERDGWIRQLRTAHWGLVPFWAKDTSIGQRLINARAETVTEKRAYQQAAKKRRCLVPADGYYEWERDPAGRRPKQPHFLHAEDGSGLAFAGLYELWKNPDVAEGDPHRWLLSNTILTRTAADHLGHIHDRMPVVLPVERIDAWLDPTLHDPHDVRELLAGIPDPRLVPRPVSTKVNNVCNDGAELLESLSE
jgi:putative SOS response-associated peptidase YedK